MKTFLVLVSYSSKTSDAENFKNQLIGPVQHRIQAKILNIQNRKYKDLPLVNDYLKHTIT
jgi:hypothetical protein